MKINKDKICVVKIHINEVYDYYKYQKEQGFIFKSKPGFYGNFGYDLHPTTIEDIEWSGMLFYKDKKVYCKPYVQLRMVNGDNIKYYFNSEKELNEFLEEHIKGNNWIEYEML